MKRIRQFANGIHPEPGRLLDYAEKRLSDSDATSVGTHLNGCSRCRKRVAELDQLRGTIRGSHLEATPGWLAHWADDVPRLHPRQKGAGRLVPALVFDSWQAVPAPARSLSPGPRRLVYRAGSHDLDMELEPLSPGTTRLIGQILGGQAHPADFHGGMARILAGKRVVARSPLDEDGRFHFDGLASRKSCTLLIEAPDLHLELPHLDL